MAWGAGLRARIAYADQGRGLERERRAVAEPEILERGDSDHLRLVESAVAQLASEERHGHDERRPRPETLAQREQHLRQHPAEHRRGGANAVILEQLDQVAQSGVVAAVRRRLVKGRLGALAEFANTGALLRDR